MGAPTPACAAQLGACCERGGGRRRDEERDAPGVGREPSVEVQPHRLRVRGRRRWRSCTAMRQVREARCVWLVSSCHSVREAARPGGVSAHTRAAHSRTCARSVVVRYKQAHLAARCPCRTRAAPVLQPQWRGPRVPRRCLPPCWACAHPSLCAGHEQGWLPRMRAWWLAGRAVHGEAALRVGSGSRRPEVVVERRRSPWCAALTSLEVAFWPTQLTRAPLPLPQPTHPLSPQGDRGPRGRPARRAGGHGAP